MGKAIIGSEAIAAGIVTPGQLRWNYGTIYPNVRVPKGSEPSLHMNIVGAWLWSRRRGVVTGRAAAFLHGALWVDERSPIELIYPNNHRPPGVITRNERITDDEICELFDMPVTAAHRTAFDLGRFLPRIAAVAHLDALARATGVSAKDVLPLADRYKGARGVRRLRDAIALMDGGSQSPKESWLRVLFVDAGFPPPTTQVPVYDRHGVPFAYLDMGWEDIMVAVEYDGDHHRSDRDQYIKDIYRIRTLEQMGWIIVRVISEDRPYDIIIRVREAFDRREAEHTVVNRRG